MKNWRNLYGILGSLVLAVVFVVSVGWLSQNNKKTQDDAQTTVPVIDKLQCQSNCEKDGYLDSVAVMERNKYTLKYESHCACSNWVPKETVIPRSVTVVGPHMSSRVPK